MGYQKLIQRVGSILKTELSDLLTYHDYKHAKDVLKCVNTAIENHEFDDHKIELFRIAAISHDVGHIDTYKGHEERSVEIISPIMQEEGYTKKDIAFVKKLILATKPEKKVRTIEEKIIKDADLDYLGRSDFYEVALTLFNEWVAKGIIANDFNLFEKQELNFLIGHDYLTDFARNKGRANKKKRIAELKERLGL